MKSLTTRKFWRLYDDLPEDVQTRARSAFDRWRKDPNHPSLHFKRTVHPEPIYSVRVGIRHRALGLLGDDEITWFWIGAHDEYERLLS